MVNINETLNKRKGYLGNVTNSEFIKFVQVNVDNEKAAPLVEYVNGGNLKKIAKQYHIAASRVTNLFILMIDNYYDSILANS